MTTALKAKSDAGTGAQPISYTTENGNVSTPASVSPMHSDLVALQGDLPVINFDAENPHYKSKYASLAGIMQAVRPLLAKHRFSWITRPTWYEMVTGNTLVLVYELTHVTGEVAARGYYPLPDGGTPQALGSALTYARRYALCAVLGLVADDDDDGNAGSAQASGLAPAVPVEAKPKAILMGPCELCADEGLRANGDREPGMFRNALTGRVQCNGRRTDGTYANHSVDMTEIPF